MGAGLRRFTSNTSNLEISTLVWLDSTVNKLQESIDAQERLKSLTNHLETFEQVDHCEKYIKSRSERDRIGLIVSGRLSKEIVPNIHQLGQVVSIYVYCSDRPKYEAWAKEFSKVRGVAIHLNELINQIRSDQAKEQHNENTESLTFTSYNTKFGQLTTGINGQFIHSQLLIDCLLQIKSTPADIDELISICKQEYEGNKNQLAFIRKFGDEYSSNGALEWYTRDSFVYIMLNKALRTQNIHLIFLFRFLIRDLEKQLKQLKDNQSSSPLTVYRGQLMLKGEYEILKQQSIGELISINSFLSTSLDRQSAYKFLLEPTDLERVLFEIDANPKLSDVKPFANIAKFSHFSKEKEVLFMLGSIFRLANMSHDRNGVCTIKLTLCSEQDLDLKTILNHMKSQDRQGELDLVILGDVLRRMGKYNEAEKYYRRCFNELPSDDYRNISACYYALGRIANSKGDQKLSLDFLNKSLDIDLQILKPNDPNIANTYNSIANIYQTEGDYKRALDLYNKALTIFQRASNEDHRVAMCLNNIGVVYQKAEKYSEALSYYQNALTIRKKNLPPNHSDLGDSYNNIGIAYRHLGQSDKALEQYNLALKIYERSLPSQHPDIAMTFENIGIVYEQNHNWKEALSYYKKAETIYHLAFDSTHPDVLQIEQNIKRVSSKLK